MLRNKLLYYNVSAVKCVQEINAAIGISNGPSNTNSCSISADMTSPAVSITGEAAEKLFTSFMKAGAKIHSQGPIMAIKITKLRCTSSFVPGEGVSTSCDFTE